MTPLFSSTLHMRKKVIHFNNSPKVPRRLALNDETLKLFKVGLVNGIQGIA